MKTKYTNLAKGAAAMLNKIKDAILNVVFKGKYAVTNTEKPIKYIVLIYFAVVLLLMITYYAAWLYLFLENKTALADLLAIIQETISATMIGFVTFIAGCFVDLNANGVPDNLEKKDEEKPPLV